MENMENMKTMHTRRIFPTFAGYFVLFFMHIIDYCNENEVLMMKILNTTPDVLKYQIQDAIAKAIEIYRKDYPNKKAIFTQMCSDF